MVALVDELQRKGLVQRRPQAEDRRKNSVALTREGRDTMQRGAHIADECEREFLAPLDDPDAEQLKRALQAVIGSHRGGR
jgi:DNA-binding MarR family transcriptional regulator